MYFIKYIWASNITIAMHVLYLIVLILFQYIETVVVTPTS